MRGAVSVISSPLLRIPRQTKIVRSRPPMAKKRKQFRNSRKVGRDEKTGKIAPKISPQQGDPSEPKRTEREKVGHHYGEAILRAVPVPFLVLRPDLRVNTASEAFYATFRVAPAATEGRLVYEIGTGQWDIPQLRKLLEEILPQHTIFTDFEVTHEFERLGRRTILLNARRTSNLEGMPDHILLAIEDITARREAEVLQARLSAIVSSADDAILSKTMDGVVTTWNASAERMFGYTAEEIIGNPRLHLTPPELRAEDEQLLKQVRAGNPIKHFETQRMTKDGRRLPVSLTISPIKNARGEVIGASKIARDITERKTGEEALHRALAQAERASRAKDDFLAALSHELRTPLTPVLLSAVAMRDDERLPADLRAQLSMMERNIALEARLIDDLLDLTTISRGKLQLRPERCDTHALIGLAIEIVQAEANAKEITLARMLDAPHSGLVADPARFQQVIWNLLRNAVKFTARGGRISIRTSEEKTPGGARWLRIEVADSGIGIDAAQLEKIFAPFEQGGLTGDHRYGGLGLGLAIARSVVELHGGRISAHSEGADRGATFVVELPGAIDAQSGSPASITPVVAGAAFPLQPLAAPSAPAAGLRLLLVEDHESTLRTLALLLRRDGHHVTAATTLAAAVAAAAAEQLDLVISDLGLPDGTGNELMEKLRSAHGLRGVALSGYGMEEDLARSRAAGFVAHLVKPIQIAELRRVIASLAPGK